MICLSVCFRCVCSVFSFGVDLFTLCVFLCVCFVVCVWFVCVSRVYMICG